MGGRSSALISETDSLIKRFLLGELPDDERVALEERFIKEDGFYNEVLAIQEELADTCVNGDLSPKERAQLEDYFMRSPRRQKRIEFAAALSQALVQPTQRELTASAAPWWRTWFVPFRPRLAWAATAAAIAFLLISSWLWMQNRHLSNRVEKAQVEKDSLLHQSSVSENAAAQKARELEDQIAALKAEGGDLKASIELKEKELEALRRAGTAPGARTASVVNAFILSPGLTRDTDEPEKLVLPTTSTSLRLQLDLEHEANYKGYLVEVRTARGNLVWSKSDLPIHKTSYGQAVSFVVPSNVLSNGEYEITLKGSTGHTLEAVGYYYFIILRR